MYRISISVLAALLLSTLVPATDVSLLPSRKAEVVLPRLKQFSSKDNYTRITQILGKEDLEAGNSIHDCFYGLDDGTGIRVRADLGCGKVYSIFRQGKGIHDIQVIFALDKTWEH